MMFFVFIVFLILGVPIAFTVGWSTLSVYLMDPTFSCDAEYFMKTMVNGMDSYVLLAIPLFMLSSSIMAESGMSQRLYDFFSYFFGNIPAGLPIAVVITCLFYGAICGSGPATVAAIGTMCIPLLTSLGYDKEFVTAMIAVAGGLGVIIPPSIPFITYGLATGASIGDMFIAGVAPGILIALCLIAYIIFYFRKKEKREALSIERNTKALREKGFLRIFKESFFALLAPVIILGGIYGGIVSPTEAACVSVVYALLVGVLAYRVINLKKLIGCLIDTARTATPVMLILSISIVFGRVLTILNLPQTLASFVVSHVESKFVVLIVINLFLLFAGMVMDTVPCILILAPIMLPIVQQYGVDTIHFGVMMTVNLAIGFVTPPIGTNLFVANSITKIPIIRIAKHALPFIAMFILALLLITYIPQITLFLPNLLN
ncbi:TRAP transporter large permease [Cuneatibacter sp. NSJ-177]|uniref:TRAP transporter large permease n=1 Tax=Cuneatibacter sp. NSJ-177 TaxID=2931401 RepID=UPI001FD40255|nr:TRAP transporter large permease [Cuneatibacter sp. NSJ-177]MCJ7836202.1 TRAP transporter large permease [Cuneatibacter sp. NSJ-177]